VNGFEALLFGFGLGVRHAMDADHVVLVSTLLSREPGPRRAARLAALWGAGHTLAFLGLGLFVILTGLQVPEAFERAAEVLIAALLVGFGAWHLLRSFQQQDDPGTEQPPALARPVAIGLVHGLAGSAGVALLAATTLPSRTLAAVYLCVVAFGTVFGMVALTLAMSHPLAWTMKREGLVGKTITLIAGGLGIGLGLWILLVPLLGDAAPP
jgi:nickel/cobalt transporter (NicO) family protein